MLKIILAATVLGIAVSGAANAGPIVIVHGAFQTASTWTDVAERLRAAGEEVIVVDLPGRNGAGTDPHALTLDTYRDVVLGEIADRADVVLLGHSFGGFTISAAAEAAPEKIARLVYVAAYVPEAGESLQTLSATDPDTRFNGENFVVAADWSTADVLARDRVLIFANDAEPAVADGIAAALVKEPLAPMAAPVTLTDERFGVVPKAYVKTLRDHAVSPAMQDRMIARAGITAVASLDTGHAPSVTRPEEMAAAILAFARD